MRHLLEEQAGSEGGAQDVTPEQLLTMDEGGYELIDGKLVERRMGARASEVAMNAMRIVGDHVHAHKSGKCFGADCGYQIFPDAPKRVRYPDGSFIAKGRLPEGLSPGSHVSIPPDLAVEAVSPNDTAEDVEAKRLAFLRAGVRLLWIIYPQSRTVHVYRQDGTATALNEGDTLSAEDVLPGFTCNVSAFFEEG
jgi:Uma2 family endonuclease